MRAVVFDSYGSIDSLRVEELDKPEPKSDEVRLKVIAASVNPEDIQMINGRFTARLKKGIFKPGKTIPGIDVAGMVDAMGPEAIGCTWGQEVYADLSDYGYGGFAEYVCVPKSAIALKPHNLTYEEAAAVPMAATAAFQGLLNWGEMLSYRSALIIGASGGVGHFAAQFAKHYDLQVTAVVGRDSEEFARSIGVDHVVYSDDDGFFGTGNKFELIFDTRADRSAKNFRKMLTKDGRYVACAFSPSALIQSPFGGILNNRRIITFDADPNTDDLATIRKIIENGKVRPKVDRVFPLEEASAALSYMNEGNANGKVVLQVQG